MIRISCSGEGDVGLLRLFGQQRIERDATATSCAAAHLLAELFQHLLAVGALLEHLEPAVDAEFRLIDLPKTTR
jgi:hypothetical protein